MGVAAALAASLSLTACGGGSGGGADGDTFKVGVLFDLSQTYKFIGTPTLAGLRTAVHEVNKGGGVSGKELELVVKDDRSDATTARSAFQELDREGVVAVVGPNASATLTPVAPLVTRAKIPNLSLAAVTALQGKANPYLYATGLSVADSAKIDAAWISEQGADAPKVAALSLDTPSVAEFRSSLDEAIPGIGGSIVANDVVAVDATDMANAVLPVAQKNPEFVTVGLLGSQLPGLVSSMRDRGVDAPVINYFVASDDATFKAVDDDKFFAVRHFAEPSESDNPGVADMAKAAKEAGQGGDMTNAYFTHGYVVGKLLAKALTDCGSDCDAEALDKALSAVRDFDTNGLSGSLGVSDNDHFFVKYGRVFGWDSAKKVTKPLGDWISAEG